MSPSTVVRRRRGANFRIMIQQVGTSGHQVAGKHDMNSNATVHAHMDEICKWIPDRAEP